MSELARTSVPGAIGCTQFTEINYTAGVALVGTLPYGFDLATLYSCGVATRSLALETAGRFVERITGDGSIALRRSAGFEDRA
jgi:molybdate transport system substrate-binding protein